MKSPYGSWSALIIYFFQITPCIVPTLEDSQWRILGINAVGDQQLIKRRCRTINGKHDEWKMAHLIHFAYHTIPVQS